MSIKNKKQEEKIKVPAYIVTFSDMVTLLLTFFLMLLSLANSQDPALFKAGKDSFVKAIQTMGLGSLHGLRASNKLDFDRPRYKIEEEEPELNERTIDPEQQRLQRSIRKLSEFLRNESKNRNNYSNHTIITGITFGPDSSTLPENAKSYLETIVQDIRSSGKIGLYVVGVPVEKQDDMILASQRAENTANYLKHKITNQAVNVYSLGADSAWFGKTKNKDKSHIWISVVKENSRTSGW